MLGSVAYRRPVAFRRMAGKWSRLVLSDYSSPLGSALRRLITFGRCVEWSCIQCDAVMPLC